MNKLLLRLLILAEVALGASCCYFMMYYLPTTDRSAVEPDDDTQARHYLMGIPGLDTFMKIIIPWFRRATKTPLGKANWTIFLGSLPPLLVRMVEASSCKGARKGLVRCVFLWLFISQLLGAGCILPALWFPLFALSEEGVQAQITSGSYVVSKGRVRAILIASMLLLVNAMGFLFLPEGKLWDYNTYVFQFALPVASLFATPFKANDKVLSGVQNSERSSFETQLLYAFTAGSSYLFYVLAIMGYYYEKAMHGQAGFLDLLQRDIVAQPVAVKMLLTDHLAVSATLGAVALVDAGLFGLLTFLLFSVFASPGAAFALVSCSRIFRSRQKHNVRMEKME